MAVAKDQIRQIITENNITSVADVYSLLKDSFKDILQELLEAEMDATLGYEKNCKGDLKSDNKRNGHSPKTLKSQYGEFQIDVPRDRNGEFEPKLIPKYQRDISGIEEKVISLYARGMSTRDIHDQIRNFMGLNFRRNGQQNHGQNPSGSERVAVSSTEPCISFCFYGLYPLQSPGRRQDPQPRCLYCTGSYRGRIQGYSQYYRRSE